MSQTLFRSPRDVHAYVRELSTRRPEDNVWVKAWRAAKRMTLAALLAASFLIYYLVSVINDTLALPELVVSVQVKAPRPNSDPPGFR